MIQFGGDGTPAVAEFAPAELGAALGISYHCACALIGDALDLRHRYPMLWTRLQAGQIKTWAARRIAQTTRHLTVHAAAQVDRVIAPYADRKNPADLVAFAQAEAIRADPDLARQRAEAAKTSRGVWATPTPTPVSGRCSSAPTPPTSPGSTSPSTTSQPTSKPSATTHRKTNAARKQSASSPPPSSHSTCTPKPPARPPPPTRQGSRPPPSTSTSQTKPWPTVTVSPGSKASDPSSLSQIADWLQHDRIAVKPVIDLNCQAPVDAYEIPDRLRQAVHLAMPTDVFPYATNKTRHKDIDHTIAYTGTGPPGQTGIGNLAPITRRHHRIKTHSRWKVKQPFPGILIWQSPHGAHYLVDNTGTRLVTTAA